MTPTRWQRAALVTVVSLTLGAGAARAQGPDGGPGVVLGRVTAEDGRPLASASVVVRSAADSSVVAGQLTGASGQFRLTGLPAGRYRVEASLLGYAPHRGAAVTITAAAPTADVGTVLLRSRAIALDEVRVRGEPSRMVVAPDRTIYNLSDMPVAAGGMATEVLENVPELEVDIDGNVALRGAEARIFINGRPPPMQGEALTLFLQQFPADRIERVEVIPDPSARHEAEGTAGIVNIVLRRNVNLGLSGSVFANAGTRGDTGLGGRLALQDGRLTLFGGSSVRLSDRRTDSYDLRQNLLADPTTFLEQDGWSERTGLSGNLDLTAEWKLSDHSTLWTEAGLDRNGFDAEGVTDYVTMVEAGDARAVTGRYDRASLDESDRFSTDLGAGLRHRFGGEEDHELSLEVEYQVGGSERLSRIQRRLRTEAGAYAPLPVQLTTDESHEDEAEVSAELEYVRPWSDAGRIELGYELETQDTDDDRVREIFAELHAATPLSSARTGFLSREVFHSAHATLVRRFGALSGQLGLRAERVDTRFEFAGLEAPVENDHFSLFPNASLSYDIDEERRVRLSYSRRIRRPQSRVLNPVDQSNDPLNRSVGNPHIDPMYTHSFSVESSWTGRVATLRLSPYFRHTAGDWAQIKTVDEAGVSTVTWQNLTSIDSYGTTLSASLRPVGGIGGNVSVSGYHEVRDASNLSLDYSGSSTRWSARGQLSARLTSSLEAQAMLAYNPARDVPQGRISASVMTNLGIRQRFGERASLNVRLSDPFDLYRSSFQTRDPSHIQVGRSRESRRSAVVTFSYTFGRPPRGQSAPGEEAGQAAPEEEQLIR